MKANVEEIKRVFFAAMMQGYAVSGPKETLPDGSKQYRYREGDWEVVDRYWVNEGEKFSWGYTQISFRGQPVWWMSYGGEYDKEAISFLKEALRKNYSQSEFSGGRGPVRYLNGSGMLYNNTVCSSDFAQFFGFENVDADGERGGFHQYQGGLLFRPD